MTSQSAFSRIQILKALDEVKPTKQKVYTMKIANDNNFIMKATIFFDTRSQARTIKSGKLVDLGIEANKRWGRTVQIEHKQKDNTLTLTSCKDIVGLAYETEFHCVAANWRYPENAKSVQVKVKKLKEMI